MTNYIEKNVLAAEINRLIKSPMLYKSENVETRISVLEHLLSFLDTIEVKEMDLEKEVEDWVKTGPHTSYPWCTILDAIRITAEHFFELGLKQKENNMTDKEKIRKEVERLQKELVKEKEKGLCSDVDDACILELQNVLIYIDSLQEKPVNKDLEDYAKKESESFAEREYEIDYIDRNALAKGYYWGVKAGAQWQKQKNTIEVKEVDLQHEVESYWKQCDMTWCRDAYSMTHIRSMLSDIAKHFFELGLKTKGE